MVCLKGTARIPEDEPLRRRASGRAVMKKTIRQHIVFHGSVQGVGFRWRAEHAAARFCCTGWCFNEWDGTVVMEIQGTEENIGRVIRAIAEGRYVMIERMDVTAVPPAEHERGFRAE